MAAKPAGLSTATTSASSCRIVNRGGGGMGEGSLLRENPRLLPLPHRLENLRLVGVEPQAFSPQVHRGGALAVVELQAVNVSANQRVRLFVQRRQILRVRLQ